MVCKVDGKSENAGPFPLHMYFDRTPLVAATAPDGNTFPWPTASCLRQRLFCTATCVTLSQALVRKSDRKKSEREGGGVVEGWSKQRARYTKHFGLYGR